MRDEQNSIAQTIGMSASPLGPPSGERPSGFPAPLVAPPPSSSHISCLPTSNILQENAENPSGSVGPLGVRPLDFIPLFNTTQPTFTSQPIFDILRSEPRFMAFLGVDAPSMTDLLPARHGRFPPHLKPGAVARCGSNQRALLLALPTCDLNARENCRMAMRWLHDDSLYEEVMARAGHCRRRGFCSFGPVQMNLMSDAGKTGADPFPELPGSFLNVFGHEEPQKFRERIIMESLYNDLMTPTDLLRADGKRIHLPTRNDVRSALTSAAAGGTRPYVVALDLQAFFDQFELEQRVQRFHRLSRGGVSRVLTMGSKQSCLISQCTIELLAAFEHRGVFALCYIDNFFLIGSSRSEVKSAALALIDRIIRCNFLLNDVDVSSPASIDTFVNSQLDTTVLDILGDRYDLNELTVTLTTNTRNKLTIARTLLTSDDALTARQACAVFGVVLFASAVLDQSACHYWVAMNAFRDVASFGQASSWSTSAKGHLSSAAVLDTLAWIDGLLSSDPHHFNLKVATTSIELTVDASAYGVGAVCCIDGKTSFHSIPWSAEERVALEAFQFSSTRTEPCAAVRAVLVCVPAAATLTSTKRHVVIRTDHLGLVFAGQAGRGRCWAYNEAVRRLHLARPDCTFTWIFIPGKVNTVADRLSRGMFVPHLAPPAISVKVGSASLRFGSAQSVLPSVRVG